jgi:hypothetical protein
MKRVKVVAAGVALALCAVPVSAAVLPSTPAVAKGTVQEAATNCYWATAVLLVGDGSDRDRRWAMIQAVIDQARVWQVVPDVKQGWGGTCTYTQYDITNPQHGGPTEAYTCECGSGATCNEIAKTFLDRFQEMQPAPFVICGGPTNNNIFHGGSHH